MYTGKRAPKALPGGTLCFVVGRSGWSLKGDLQSQPMSTLKHFSLFLQEELRRLQNSLEQVDDGKYSLQR